MRTMRLAMMADRYSSPSEPYRSEVESSFQRFSSSGRRLGRTLFRIPTPNEVR